MIWQETDAGERARASESKRYQNLIRPGSEIEQKTRRRFLGLQDARIPT